MVFFGAGFMVGIVNGTVIWGVSMSLWWALGLPAVLDQARWARRPATQPLSDQDLLKSLLL